MTKCCFRPLSGLEVLNELELWRLEDELGFRPPIDYLLSYQERSPNRSGDCGS